MSTNFANVGTRPDQPKSDKHGREIHVLSATAIGNSTGGATNAAPTTTTTAVRATSGDYALSKPPTNITRPYTKGATSTVGSNKPKPSGRGGKSAMRGGARLQQQQQHGGTVDAGDPPEYLNRHEADAIHKRKFTAGGLGRDGLTAANLPAQVIEQNAGLTQHAEHANARRSLFPGGLFHSDNDCADENSRPPVLERIPPTTLQMDTTAAARFRHRGIAGNKVVPGTTTTTAETEENYEEKDGADESVDSGDDTSEYEYEYIGSDLQMLKRPKPRRLEADIVGLSHGIAPSSQQQQQQQQQEEKDAKGRDVVFRKRAGGESGGNVNRKSAKSLRRENSFFTECQKIVHITDEDDMDDLFMETLERATDIKKRRHLPIIDDEVKRGSTGSSPDDSVIPSRHKENKVSENAGGRKYIGLTEYERGVKHEDEHGNGSNLARGNPARFDAPFVKKDVLDAPPFPFRPPNTVVFWMCRTCREISQRAKGKRFENGRTTFTIDICKACRTLNCEAYDTFQGDSEEPEFDSLGKSDIEPCHQKYPYPVQYTLLAGPPFSLTRTEAIVLLMCEYCRNVTSFRECMRDVNGRCRLTIDMCQKCTDANYEMSMSTYPTQAELDRTKDRRDYFAGMYGGSSNKIVHTAGKCVRD